MENGLFVKLLEKKPDGQLRNVDERTWSKEMIEALHHVNYVTINGEEFETVEGRLDIDGKRMELLVVAVQNRSLA